MDRFVVGTKQVLKAVSSGKTRHVYIAYDADTFLIDKIERSCRAAGVESEKTASMEELGRRCAIDVGAACVATLVSD